MVEAEFVCEWRSRVVHKPRRMYRKGNFVKIIEGLNQVDWEGEFEGKSVQECWDIFKVKLEELVDKYVPMSVLKDYNEPWMNKSLLRG